MTRQDWFWESGTGRKFNVHMRCHFAYDDAGRLDSVKDPFGFVNKVSYDARWYDKERGRFVSNDEIGVSGGINFYAHTDNNPVNLIDIGGYSPSDCKNKLLQDYQRIQNTLNICLAVGYAWCAFWCKGSGPGYGACLFTCAAGVSAKCGVIAAVQQAIAWAEYLECLVKKSVPTNPGGGYICEPGGPFDCPFGPLGGGGGGPCRIFM